MSRRPALIAAVAAAAAVAAPSPAAADVPPVPGGTSCTMKAQDTYRHAAVLRQGVPVQVSCDGPATVRVFLEFSGSSAANRWALSNLFPESSPGAEAFTRGAIVFTDAGSRTARLRLWPWAQRVAARFARTQVNISLTVKREDGYFWSVAGRTQRAKSTLVR